MITFSLLVIEYPLNTEREKRFCLVHEIDDRCELLFCLRSVETMQYMTNLCKRRGWWLPGGGVDDGIVMARFFVCLQENDASFDQAKALPKEALVKLAKKRVSAKLTAV